MTVIKAAAPGMREIDVDDVDDVAAKLMDLARLVLNLAELEELADSDNVMNALAQSIFNIRNELIKAGAYGNPTG